MGSCNITKLVNVALSNMSANVDMLYLKRYSRICWHAYTSVSRVIKKIEGEDEK